MPKSFTRAQPPFTVYKGGEQAGVLLDFSLELLTTNGMTAPKLSKAKEVARPALMAECAAFFISWKEVVAPPYCMAERRHGGGEETIFQNGKEDMALEE